MLTTMWKYFFFVCLFSLLISCSNGASKEEVYENKIELITDVKQLSINGSISQIDYEDAVQNIISFEQKSFIGKYWWLLPFIIILIILLGLVDDYTDIDEDQMTKPITSKKSYLVICCLGFLGGHYLYLKKFKWIGFLTIILTFLFPLWNFKYLMYFYNLPSIFFLPNIDCIFFGEMGLFYKWQLILGVLFVINILVGVIFAPYWVYQFNGNYFRKHKDNDDILNGRELEVDKFYNSVLVPDIKRTNEDADTVKEVLNDEDFTISDESDENISGFFKSIFTLGKSSTLKRKIQRLRALRYCCQTLSEDIDKFETDNNRLFYYLKYYRIAAYRNLYLAKELIGIVKEKVSSRQQELIRDEFPELLKPQNVNPSDVYFDATQVSFNSDRFFDSVGQSFMCSFDAISEKLENEKDISKDDFLVAGIEVAIDGIIAGIEEVFDQYSRTTASIRKVEGMISKAVNYLDKAYPSIIKYQAELMRQSELMVALNQCNRAFVMAYEPLRNNVWGRPTFSKFIHGINKDQQYLKSEGFRKDLQHLILVCTEYNKVYNSKTGNDTDKIEKPSYSPSPLKKDKKDTENKSLIADNCNSYQELSRDLILSTIRKALKNEHINEGNTIAYLGLHNRRYAVEGLCKQLGSLCNKAISEKDIFGCRNIKEVIDFVIK